MRFEFLKAFRLHKHLTAAFAVFAILVSSLGGARSQDKFSAMQFAEDCALLKRTMEILHPGIYRYLTKEDLDRNYSKATDLSSDSISIRESFLRLSEFVAGIKCGHTMLNPYNQSDFVKSSVISGKDKLPFAFDFVDREMIITSDVSGSGISRGSVIRKINGVPAEQILEALLVFADGDGNNDVQRIFNCRVTGIGEHEFSDIYLPLVVPPAEGKYEIEYSDPVSRAGFLTRTVEAISREERFIRLQAKGAKRQTLEDLWNFRFENEKTGILSIGTFVTYNSKFDWKNFLAEAFKELSKKKTPNLIIDIRGNGGGSTEVAWEIISYLIDKPLTLDAEDRLVRYLIVPDDLRPYLSTWDDSFYDRTGSAEKFNEEFYKLKSTDVSNAIEPKEQMYKGKVYVMTDGSNSSATFILAKLLRDNGRATLAGSTTGGNLKGINGGNIMFLTLPNTGIEVDIPLIGYFPKGNQPDSGITPDIDLIEAPEELRSDDDVRLKKLLEIIG